LRRGQGAKPLRVSWLLLGARQEVTLTIRSRAAGSVSEKETQLRFCYVQTLFTTQNCAISNNKKIFIL
jgi:hypothetical protein